MKFTVERNWIEIIGPIWWPVGAVCAQRRDLSAYDMANIGEVTRDNVEHWLCLHCGDFSYVKDFHAVIGETEIPWADPESEFVYSDCMFPCEE